MQEHKYHEIITRNLWFFSKNFCSYFTFSHSFILYFYSCLLFNSKTSNKRSCFYLSMYFIFITFANSAHTRLLMSDYNFILYFAKYYEFYEFICLQHKTINLSLNWFQMICLSTFSDFHRMYKNSNLSNHDPKVNLIK